MPQPLLLELSTFLGAAVLFFTVWCLATARRRVLGVLVGCAGMLTGALAALVYTLVHMARGVDIDFIPHEPAAQWFVAGFGWSGVLVLLAAAFVPSVRSRVNGPPLALRGSKRGESG